MLLSTTTAALQAVFGPQEAVRILKEIGFDAYDMSLTRLHEAGFEFGTENQNYVQTAKQLRAYADAIGITCNQSHAPYPLHKDENDPKNRERNIDWNEHILSWCIKALEITSILGGKHCIIHPYNNWSPRENAERVYQPLLPYAKKFGVKIAVENMWNWPQGSPVCAPAACALPENFVAHMDLLDPEWFVACVDIGHGEMFKGQSSARELLLALGDRVQTLHVHDNDCWHDDHTFPFFGKIDWECILSTLKEINYQGVFTFEADYPVRKFPNELKQDALTLLYKTGRYLLRRLNEIK